MTQQARTRTQRRMEKKQAILLIAVLLVASLVCFCLGVMVGRGNPGEEVVQTTYRPVAVPPPAPTQQVAPAQAGDTTIPAGSLTFYDSLPKGEQPIGSGINLPPETPAKAAPAPEPAPTKQPVVAEKKVEPAKPAPLASEGYVVQIASFQQQEQATALSTKLAQKGFATFTQPADLGAKGLWHRVYCGPFGEKTGADQVAERLLREEKLNGLVRKQ